MKPSSLALASNAILAQRTGDLEILTLTTDAIQPRASYGTAETDTNHPTWEYWKTFLDTVPLCIFDETVNTSCEHDYFDSKGSYWYIIDLPCFCGRIPGPSYANCTTTKLETAVYHRWLNFTCADQPNWKALPAGWQEGSKALDILHIGDSWPYPKGKYMLPDMPQDNLDVLYRSLASAMSMSFANASLQAGVPVAADGTWLERSNICGVDHGDVLRNFEPKRGRGGSYWESTYLLWMNSTCVGAATFQGMPPGWEAILSSAQEDAWYSWGLLGTLPSCADRYGDGCNGELTPIFNTATVNVCEDYKAKGYCTLGDSYYSISIFCSMLSYPSTCGSTDCMLPFQRGEWLNWLNETCAWNASWKGLPNDWVEYTTIGREDLLPWSSIVAPNAGWAGSKSCPSAPANLAAFAGVNLAMLVLTPLLGRRAFVYKLSFGRLGRPDSHLGWKVVGPLTAALQLAANGINIAGIKKAPGYSDVDAKTLLMLWVARPRLAWLVVVLMPLQIDRAMYVSCAASALTSEIILQLLSTYVMGYVANHGRRIGGVYETGEHAAAMERLAASGAARAMYWGALAWLILIFFTLLILGWAMICVTEVIDRAGMYMGLDVWREKAMLRKAKKLLAQVSDEGKAGSPSPYLRACEILVLSLKELIGVLNTDAKELRVLQLQLKRLVRERDKDRRHPNDRMDPRPVELDNQIEHLRTALRYSSREGLKTLRVDSYTALAVFPTVLHVFLVRSREPTSRRWYRETFSDWAFLDQLPTDREFYFHELRICASDTITRDDYTGSPRSKTGETKPVGRPDFEELSEKLVALWESLEGRSNNSMAPKNMEPKVVLATCIGMSACWIAQWMFWGGLMHLYTPDRYCPPNLGVITTIWLVFSILGIPIGAGV